MSVRAFVGFDLSKNLPGGSFPGTNWTNVSAAYSGLALPAYVAHGNYLSPWNPDGLPALNKDNQNFWFFTRNSSAGMSFGHGANGGAMVAPYTAATTLTRAGWRTAKGHQMAVSRSRVIPALTNAELWFSMEIAFPSLGGSSIASGLSADAYGAIWRWGDLSLYFKSTTWVSGTTHHITFSVRNGASEIATVTVNSVATTNTHASAPYLYVLIHAKLDASTGLIDVAINGNAQSASYTGQNTVATTAEAAATEIFFGPPVSDDGTNVYVGAVDNFLIDDAAWPAGVPTVRIISLPSDVSATGVAATGSGATTIAEALNTSSNDVKHARWSSITGTCLINTTMPSSTGMLADVLGFEIVEQRMVNRYPVANVKVRVGLDISSTETEDEYTQVAVIPFSSSLSNPETLTASASPVAQIFEKTGGGGKYQTSDLANIDLKLTAQT